MESTKLINNMDLQEIVRKEVHRILLEARDPTQREIETHALEMAKKYEVPFDIIMRHMWIESRYKLRARSEEDAYGLMQLMPKTAEALGVDRDDWRQNIEGGAKYLRNLWNRLDKRALDPKKANLGKYGAKGVKDKWEAVAIAYYSGGGGFNKLARAAAKAGYVDENGLIDWKRYNKETGNYEDRVKYARAIHDPTHRIQKSRYKRRGKGYTIDVPEENISAIGRRGFADEFKLGATKSPSAPATGKPTIIYIGDSSTGGMKRYLERTARENGQNIKVFHVDGAGAAVMHTMVTGERNPVSKAIGSRRENQALDFARQIKELKAQGPVSIRIATIGGNDRWRSGSSLDRYTERYARPLFGMVDEVGGSARANTPERDELNKKINDHYKKLANDVGVTYYQARGEDGKDQVFGRSDTKGYYQRQAQERFKFSMANIKQPEIKTPESKESEPVEVDKYAGLKIGDRALSDYSPHLRDFFSDFAERTTPQTPTTSTPAAPQTPQPPPVASAPEPEDHDHDHDHDHEDYEPIDMSKFKRGHKGSMLASFPGAKGVHIKNPSRTHGNPAMHNYLRSLSGFDGRQWYVEDVSRKGGGQMRGHASHRYGRDVDLAIPTLSKNPYDGSRMSIYQRQGRKKWNFATVKPDDLDVAASLSFIRHTSKGAKVIYLDKGLIAPIKAHAKELTHTGQMDQEEYDKIFKGYSRTLKHWKNHKGHFHVRLKKDLDVETYKPPPIPDPPEVKVAKIETPKPEIEVPKIDTPTIEQPKPPAPSGQDDDVKSYLKSIIDDSQPQQDLKKVVEEHLKNYFGV